ncbi:MAG: hypothetical protein U1F11_00985 [Steroidobacteraceae bacterium]
MTRRLRIAIAATFCVLLAAAAVVTLLVVVSNTYWWTPDLPTLRYLARARLPGIATLGVIGGAGSTDRSRRMLEEALRRTGASVRGVQAYWLLRPNDEARLAESNRGVALQMAREWVLRRLPTATPAG